MADLASLSADQLAEKARSIMGDHNERVAAVAELQTRANQLDTVPFWRDALEVERSKLVIAESRAKATEKERDEAKEARDNWRQAQFNSRVRAEAAEARLAETQEALEAAQALYERVEMDESVGICLSDRVPSLRLGAALAALTTHPEAGDG